MWLGGNWVEVDWRLYCLGLGVLLLIVVGGVDFVGLGVVWVCGF